MPTKKPTNLEPAEQPTAKPETQRLGEQFAQLKHQPAEMAAAMMDSVALASMPERTQLEKTYDAIAAAAEAEDFELASRLFQQAQREQEAFRAAVSAAADRMIERGVPRLVDGMDKAALEATQES